MVQKHIVEFTKLYLRIVDVAPSTFAGKSVYEFEFPNAASIASRAWLTLLL